MTQAVQNSTVKSNTPTEYAKLYYAKKPEDNTFDGDSIFGEILPASQYISELHINEESEKFFKDKKSVGTKLAAGGEAFLMTFVGSMGIMLISGMGFLNKISERNFDKIGKAIAIGQYALCFLFAYLSYNVGNKYNKKLDELNDIYHKSDKKARKKADKVIKKLCDNPKYNHGMSFIDDREKISQMQNIIDMLNKDLLNKYTSKAQ